MASKDYLYPDVSSQTVKLIEIMRQTFLDNPDYFEHSPYPPEVVKYLKGWFHKPIGDEPDTDESQTERDLMGDDRYNAIYIETVKLFGQLKAAKPIGTDAAEAMSYFRTAAQLQEKVLSLQERALGIKAVHEFHTVVMDIMENTLTEEQRDEAMKRLKNAIKSN